MVKLMIKWKERYKNLKKPNIPSLESYIKEFNLDRIIKLNYNESNYGASPKVKNYKYQNTHTHSYPQYISHELISKLSNLYNINENMIWLSNGSDAILDSLPSLFASQQHKQNIIIPDLTYNRIAQTCLVHGINVKKIKLKCGYIDLNGILDKIDDKTRVIYVVNPNMPTGTTHSLEIMESFIKQIPNNILIVLDEAYMEYAVGIQQSFYNDHYLLNKYNNLLITRTFSKLFAIASLRIGYVLSNKKTIDLFKRAIQIFPLPDVSSKYALLALSDLEFYKNIVRIVENERKHYYELFRENNLKFYKSYANFVYLVTRNEKWTNSEMRLYLLKKYGILIRNVQDFALRITIGTPNENKLVLQGIQEFLNEQNI